MKELDARKLACPQPVIELRKLLESGAERVRILVADGLSRSNVERFARSRGATVAASDAPGGGFALEILAGAGSSSPAPGGDLGLQCELPSPGGRPLVVQVTSATMGAGDDELGGLLLRSFLKTQLQLGEERPDTVVFYNAGVRLCCEGSPLLDDLRQLEEAGTEILACGTCLNYFELAPRLRIGRVTDMLEIATRLATAARTVRP